MSTKPTPQEAMDFMFEAVVYQRIDLAGPWQGWRLRGRELVSPDGDRITPERLKGIAWRMQAEARRDKARTQREAQKRAQEPVVTVVRLPLSDWQREHFGAVAG